MDSLSVRGARNIPTDWCQQGGATDLSARRLRLDACLQSPPEYSRLGSDDSAANPGTQHRMRRTYADAEPANAGDGNAVRLKGTDAATVDAVSAVGGA